jgi:hypothetical protein
MKPKELAKGRGLETILGLRSRKECETVVPMQFGFKVWGIKVM